MKQFHKIDVITMLVITLLGIFQGQVTVFYIIYLFWFQELIRTLVDFGYLLWQKKNITQRLEFVKLSFGSFFILFIYVVFIVVLFGVMLNWGNPELLSQNMLVLLFRNWYFNANMLLFCAQYLYFRTHTDNQGLELQVFNRRHIILHISIILGAAIQLAMVPHLHIESNSWASVGVIIPFLLLKIFLDKEEKQICNEQRTVNK